MSKSAHARQVCANLVEEQAFLFLDIFIVWGIQKS